MARSGTALAIGLLVVVLGAGCAGQTGDAGRSGGQRPSGAAKVEPAWTSCPAATGSSTAPVPSDNGAASTLPLLDDGFHAVAAVLCQSATRRRTDGGTEMVATENRADEVTELVAALRLPDKPHTDGPCTADLIRSPYLVLLDEQGRWLRPGVPVDECGKPRIEVRTAIQELRLTPISARPIGQVESAEAAAAGCDQRWADMVWVTASFGARTEPAAPVALYTGPAPVRICVYRVPADQQRTGKPAGDFVSGRALTGGQWAAVKRAVEAAGPAVPCTTPTDRFAVVRTATGETYVELDNCRRILAPTSAGHDALRQGSGALVALLGG